jgi:plastocyanin
MILFAVIQTVSAENRQAANSVSIKDVNGIPSFSPASITVTKGTTVTWTNNDDLSHTVTSDTGIFNSGVLNTGQTFRFTFNNIGTFNYHCSIHPFMVGKVIVVSSSSSITVTSPNGGENWIRGTTRTITWSHTGSPGSNVKIELLKGGILNRVITSGTPNDGSYSWAIPSTQVLGTDYKVKITSTSNSIYTDTSNSNFIIAGINVISPNGGENWQHGTTNTIKWSYTGNPGLSVKIELLKGGTLNRVITSSTPNDGSYSWAIPIGQTLGSDYKVRITSTTNSLYKDISNNYFRIF